MTDDTRISAILSRDLSAVPRACALALPDDCLGVWFDMCAFQRYLEKTYAFIDLMTYGVSLDASSVQVRRAVIGMTSGRTEVRFRRPPEAVKMYTNVHVKIVIGYYKGGYTETLLPVDVFVGSHNFVAPSLYDLMVQVPEHQAVLLRAYFESFWTTHKSKSPVKTKE